MDDILVAKLEAAIDDTIVTLGVGGFVRTRGIAQAFEEIDATTFANVMYATDQMLDDFEGHEAVNPANIRPTIAKYNFDKGRVFRGVEEIFRKHFGVGVVRLR
ncbi:hypothetical protein SAMN04488030_2326 [Aliiroseovarius halocynthiae]|uniref:Uncharacterized protein n=1 Tax=Aliiroseovarius halocynthiae TaxID=985055 RepID=A0A545SZJ0_9RHOB|nr:hypothetical protein [Aliiroseovarius halocynthiae]TQV70383.1 hypothetical protein FIL88_00310 [Aliiroseovarius halocynthiae]SMR81902.1 hypothetical protein SAMN04488030_2326 [Aliiroseovarius halocynthiae]